MWDAGCRLLSGLAGTQNQGKGTYTAFSKNQRSEGYLQRDSLPSIGKLLDAPGDLDYFEMQWGSFTFFSDVEPLESKEFQAGLICPASKWTKDIREQLIDVVSRTNWLQLDTCHFDVILQSLFSRVGVRIQGDSQAQYE
jgi:hypothetical protein